MEKVNPHSELLCAIASLDQYDVQGNQLEFSEFFGNGLYTSRIKNTDCCLNHYTDAESLKSIVEGRQIGLKKYDSMYGSEKESEEVFNAYKKAIDILLKQKKITKEQYAKLKQSYKRIKQNKSVFKHYFMGDINKTLECIPYCFCMTSLEYRQTESDWLREKELFINCDCIEYELKIKPGIQSEFNALEMYRVIYNDSYVVNEIKKYVMHFIKKVSDIDLALEGIEHVLSVLRIAIINRTLQNERETRLVFFLPTDSNYSQKVGELLSHKRRKNDSGEFEEIPNDDDFVYIDYNESKKIMNITCRKNTNIVERCRSLIEENDFESAVSEEGSVELKHFDLYNTILGDDISIDYCYKILDTTDYDSNDQDTVLRFFKASLALKYVFEKLPNNGLKPFLSFADSICEKSKNKSEQCFNNYVSLILPFKNCLPKKTLETIRNVSSYYVRYHIYNSNYSGIVSVLFRNDKDMLKDLFKQCNREWFFDHTVNYQIKPGILYKDTIPGYSRCGLDKELKEFIKDVIDGNQI